MSASNLEVQNSQTQTNLNSQKDEPLVCKATQIPSENESVTTPNYSAANFDDSPLFLRKTYVMIDTCNADIAQWSEDGKSFVIKDPKTFTSKVIPQFFKHKNLQSFVRQLNFYGFRKIKETRQNCSPNQQKSMRFRHHNFVRDRPDLVSGIRGTRRNNVPTADHKEVTSLKTEIDDLKMSVKNAASQIESLKSFVNQFITRLELIEQHKASLLSHEESLFPAIFTEQPLRQKVSFVHASSQESAASSTVKPALEINNNDTTSIESDNATDGLRSFDLKQIWPEALLESLDSFCSIDLDSDCIMDMLNHSQDTSYNTHSHDVALVSDKIDRIKSQITSVDSNLARQYEEAIEMLPEDMRDFFSDEQLFSRITEQSCLRLQVDSMIALAKNVANEAQEKKRVMLAQPTVHKNVAPRAA
mmetsp:Transcript_21671/g.26838  ORF Transcript_21671/g.26838 Transcript_21671/m.26838 type:complete len:416 (-) Transcript_21671:291-1538(-)|eukprot:CAMPEP_0172510722 /NCGR_PEP_ID=MMETSP1066-20121228/230818_1 /TAXON_ID=671091 /ORGANISM="Coscinodiscus wailesii, Strain CCMP2513" /LENGTH=415 /DNA_ID=CAMNT_0013289821 /DNA_START=66 /DNA_END=1313 /DNA_ORIENTATION=+